MSILSRFSAVGLVGWLADFYLLATLLMLVAIVARRWIRQPAQRMTVHWIVAVELAVLAAVCAMPFWPRISLRGAAAEKSAVETPKAAEGPMSVPAPLPRTAFPRLPREVPEFDSPAAPDIEQPVVPPIASPPRWSWLEMAAAAYLASAALVVAWLIWGAVAATRACRRAENVPDSLREELVRIVGEGGRVPRLLVGSRVKTAVALGLRRPTILLPARLLQEGSPQSLRAILTHEWAHIRNGDLWLLALGRWLLVLLFPHPLLWWLRRAIRGDQELLADAAAAGDNRPAYAEQLLRLVRKTAYSSPLAASVAVGIWESSSQLTRRIAMLLDENFRVEPRTPRRWRYPVLGLLAILGAACSLLTLQPARLGGEERKPAGPKGGAAQPATRAETKTAAPAKAKITLKSLGFSSHTHIVRIGPGDDSELDKIIKDKKYKFVKTPEAPSLEKKQYFYVLTYPDGSHVGRNFSLRLEDVTSWADYQKKEQRQRERQTEQRDERISQALTSGRFRLLNLEVLQDHVCRDVASGAKFKVQRIQLADGSEIAFPRADYGPIPAAVKQTSWQEHLQAIRDGKRELLSLETVNNYTYEMTADDGTKVVFDYGGNEPLDVLVKQSRGGSANFVTPSKVTVSNSTATFSGVSASGKTSNTTSGSTTRNPRKVTAVGGETVVGERPQGNCSISGQVISNATGKPVEGARLYLHYNVTHGSIFVHTNSDGKFEIKNIPTGPFSFSSSYTPGYQDAAYSPDGKPGIFPPFSLKDGEHRTGIVLKIKPACRISGKIMNENGKPPESKTWDVEAWFKNDAGMSYRAKNAMVNYLDGSYKIDGLGNKPVYVMAIDYRAAREGEAWPPIYYPGTFSRSDAKQVTFDKSTSVENVNITLRKEGGLVLEGTVHDEAGNPVPEAFVVAHHRDMLWGYNTAYTDAQGHYRIQGLETGQFLVHVDAAHRGFVRTRTPIDIDKPSEKSRLDFTLRRGVSISGKLVDEKGNDWQIGDSYAYAWFSEGGAHPSQFRLNEGDFSSGDFRSKYRPKNVETGLPGAFLLGEGDYDHDQAIFPTTSTFIIQGVMPGPTMIGLSPNKEKQKVAKILYGGRDILTSGIDTKPGDEIKDVTIVVGPVP